MENEWVSKKFGLFFNGKIVWGSFSQFWNDNANGSFSYYECALHTKEKVRNRVEAEINRVQVQPEQVFYAAHTIQICLRDPLCL